MRQFIRPLIPVLILFLASAPIATAQQPGGGTGGGTGAGGTGGGTGAGGTGGGAGGGRTGGGAGGGGLGGGMGTGTTTSRGGASSTSARLNQSNFLSTSYVNVYSNGLYTDATKSSGGTSAGEVSIGANGISNSPKLAATFFKTTTFGQPLYTISTTGRTAGGTATIRSGNGGRTGSGTATTSPNSFGPVISGTRALHVATVVKFATTPKSAEQLTGELTNLLERSSSVTGKKTIHIQVTDRVVLLTGNVATDDERRHVEALIALSPGVRGVVNELEVK